MSPQRQKEGVSSPDAVVLGEVVSLLKRVLGTELGPSMRTVYELSLQPQ